jgi:hypothetical protein
MKIDNFYLRAIAVFIAINLLFEICFPTIAYALTGGPSQPEVQSFEPVGTSDMVDLFSGDFNYNIPLMDVEGYPINIAYHSGVSMDQEASWVGLGWNINPGVINRNMRGLPDDFMGEQITKEFNTKPNWTAGIQTGFGVELFGIERPHLSYGIGLYYNNYKGIGIQNIINLNMNLLSFGPAKLDYGMSLTSDNQEGLSIQPSLSFSVNNEKKQSENITQTTSVGVSISSSFNSRSGTKTMGYGYTIQSKINDKTKDKNTNKYTNTSFGNNTSTLSIGQQTYIPQIAMPFANFSATVRFNIGLELFGAEGNGWMNGYYSKQAIEQHIISKPSFGYMYSHKKSGLDVLLDFNRDNNNSFNVNNPLLPIPNFTYDIYSISGQGMSGMMRPYRNDVGMLHDDVMQTTSSSSSDGIELGKGNSFHIGINRSINHADNRSQAWDNHLFYEMNFQNEGSHTYEPYYFKIAGEKSLVDKNFLPYQDLDALYSFYLKRDGLHYSPDIANLKSSKKNENNTYVKTLQKNTYRKDTRAPRTQYVSVRTGSEYQMCVDKVISTDRVNGAIVHRYNGNDKFRKPHHITELSITQPNGNRYVYGIAAYNKGQSELTYTSGNSINTNTGLIDHNFSDKKGYHIATNTENYDGYYNATHTPAYAHSYLLTSVLSNDYVDINGNGPSEDDLGTYTQINYQRVSDNYAWRIPYQNDKANLSEGLKTDPYDNKASVVYGTKEIWHVQSIESKNYIAIFHISKRLDGLAARIDESNNKITGAEQSYKLDSIQLFTKPEYSKKATNYSPIPIKTVHFKYAYTLCPGIPNKEAGGGGTGKLTLTEIYFTYAKSKKAKFNSYKFSYSANNYSYDLKKQDRWGSYKPHEMLDENRTLLTSDYPYVNQSDSTNAYAEAWSLKEIKLPSGGRIKVQYESDDYAFVQNKQAMEMFKIAGFSSDLDHLIADDLYDKNESVNKVNNYLFIDLSSSRYEQIDETYFKKIMVNDISLLYFNMLVGIESQFNKEYVRGYCEIENAGVIFKDNKKYGWILLKKVPVGDKSRLGLDDANPIAKAAWQFARLNLPHIAYPGSNFKRSNAGEKVVAILKGLVGSIVDVVSLSKNINKQLRDRKIARFVDTKASWVRLYTPFFAKKGGGSRVKKISLSDNWSEISGQLESDFDYGQEYSYTKLASVNGSNKLISSGVASYEPMIGNDENTFRRPVSYSTENFLVPDNDYYVEEPFGESFFPSPSVGYSKVTVKNIKRNNVKKHATGKTVHEFYTAQDFPTIVKYSDVENQQYEPGILNNLFAFSKSKSMTTNQSFMIELNDMHGKPKAEWTYAETEENSNDEAKLLSGIKYIYKTAPNDSTRLDNYVQIINKDGSIDYGNVGIDVDMYGDMRQNNSDNYSASFAFNTDAFVTPIPIAVIAILPKLAKDRSMYKSCVLNRVINRYGILQKTIAYQDGAIISTENLSWDGTTGEVLHTKINNEYKDNQYNISLPAYWAYERMGPAYLHTNLSYSGVTIDVNFDVSINGTTSLNGTLYLGDEVYIVSETDPSVNGLYWVENGTTNGKFKLINNANVLPLNNHTYRLHILRSGMKNLLANKMFSATMVHSPIDGNTLNISQSNQIINTSVNTYSDDWNKKCGYIIKPITICSTLVTQLDMLYLFQHLINNNLINKTDSNEQSGTVLRSSMNTGPIFSTNIPSLFDTCNMDEGNFTILHDSIFIETGFTYSQDTSYQPRLATVCKDSLIYLDSIIDTNYRIVLIDVNAFGQTVVTLEHRFQDKDSIIKISDLLLDIPCAVVNNNDNGAASVFGQPKNPVGQGNVLPIICCDTVEVIDTIIDVIETPAGYYKHNLGFSMNHCYGCFHLTLSYRDSGCIKNNGLTGMTLLNTQNRPFSAVLHFGSQCNDTVLIESYCADVIRCRNAGYTCELIDRGGNRFIDGRKGIWRAKKDFLYLDDRVIASSTTSNIRRDGFYKSYSDYWVKVPNVGYTVNSSISDRWTWTSEITNYDPKSGNAIESVDPLLRYNAVIFTDIENEKLASAVANNAKYREVGFNGFEEKRNLIFNNSEFICPSHHWNFGYSNTGVRIDSLVSHTGFNSVRLLSSNVAKNKYEIYKNTSTINEMCSTCILPFFPDTGRYVISGWIKTSADITNTDNRNGTIEVSFIGSSDVYTISPKGAIIDGWQRAESLISIPVNATSIIVTLKASNVATEITWFDDLRILPFNAQLKTYVYDFSTYRLMATLDENNYATFYEYDLQGALVRVKKETEKGIITLNESRNSNYKMP